MRNLLKFVLLGAFLFSVVFSINTTETSANSSDLGLESDESYNEVLKDVFSEDELKSLTSKGFNLDAIELFVLSGESKEDILKRELLSTSTKYYITTKNSTKSSEIMQTDSTDYLPVTSVEEVSYEEFFKRLKLKDDDLTTFSDSDSTSTDYKTMTVSISKNKTDVYTVSNTVKWFSAPLNNKEDIIGIGINDNTSPIRGTEYGTQQWYTGMSGQLLGTINYNSNSSKWNRNGDYGLVVDLVDGNCIKCVDHKISMKYDISPNVSTVKLIDAYGHYAHQETKINVSPAFTISKGVLGLSVSQEDKFTIHRPQAHAQMPK